MIVLGGIAGLIGIFVALGGVGLILLDAIARDTDGYLTTPARDFSTPTYALTSEEIDLGGSEADWLDRLIGPIRVRFEAPRGRPVFVGIGPQRDVRDYLRGVARAEIDDPGRDSPRYTTYRGGPPRERPSKQAFWAAASEGAGVRTASWEPEEGSWTVVMMNANGKRGVALEADLGADIGWLLAVGISMAVVGLLLVGGGTVAALAAARRAERERGVQSDD